MSGGTDTEMRKRHLDELAADLTIPIEQAEAMADASARASFRAALWGAVSVGLAAAVLWAFTSSHPVASALAWHGLPAGALTIGALASGTKSRVWTVKARDVLSAGTDTERR